MMCDYQIYYIHLEITGDPCNLIDSQQCKTCLGFFLIINIILLLSGNAVWENFTTTFFQK